MRRTAEHQMLEQMGKAGMLGMLVARTDIVNDVQCHHLRAGILVVYQPQAVGETMLIYLHTCVTERDSLPKGLTQFCLSVNHSHLLNLHILFRTSLRSVFTCCILSTTSMPSTTSPNTVYSPSRCGVPPTVVYAFTCSGVKRNSGSPAT